MAEVQGLDAGVSDENVILVCSDGEIKISRRAARKSEMLLGLLKVNPNAPSFETKQITREIMTEVVKYLEHYKNKEPKVVMPPLPSADLKDACDPWDVEFVEPYDSNNNIFILLNMLLAANFMDIKALKHLLAAKFATHLKTKNCEEMKKLLGITQTLTPQQENEIRKKYPEYFAWLKPPTKADEKTDD